MTVTQWAYQWKMGFNPDITKQATEVIFSCENKKPVHPDLSFNGVPVAREPFTKHLGVILDSRLNFSKHIKEQVMKAMKGVSLLKFLSTYVSRNVLDLSYKMYVRLHNDLSPSYLSEHIPNRNELNVSLRNRNVNTPLTRTVRYENSFVPYTLKAWKNLENKAKAKPSVQSFKKYLNGFIRLPGHSLFGICDKYGTKLLTKIRVSFSDLRDHRFNHNFNCESPLCKCGIEDETSVHFFLRCPLYPDQRSTLLCKISAIVCSDVTVLPDEHLFFILVYGSNVYNLVSNNLILTETIAYIRNSGRFTNLEAFS